MAGSNLQQFFEKAQSDPGLQNKIVQLIKKNEEESLENLVALGAEAGYDFSKEHLLQVIQETADSMNQGELDEEQLEAVAGGDSTSSTLGWIYLSIFSIGIGCIISKNTNCNPDLSGGGEGPV